MDSKSRYGGIAASHYLAAKSGEAAYRAGGNAVDAVLAAACTLAVVYPHNTSIGGDCIALIRRPDGIVNCVNATGWAGKHADAVQLRHKYGVRLPARGVDTITVPGSMRGFEALHHMGCRLPWASHFNDAIAYASEGVRVSRSLAGALVEFEDWHEPGSDLSNIFVVNGEPLHQGDRFVQPQLARTLRRIAERGADEFYCGDIADSLIAGLQACGSKLTKQDFVDYRVEITDPLESRYQNMRVLTSPPNTQGFALMKYLNTLVAKNIDAFDALGDRASVYAETFQAANRLRDEELSDPRFSDIDVARFTQPLSEIEEPVLQYHGKGDTVGIAAADTEGWAVSLIFSVYESFGSGVLEPNTGVLLQDRGTAFSLDEASPNVIEPRKRPRHTLMPVMVLHEDHSLAWVQSTMGGSGQPQIHAQLFGRLMHGQAPAQALAAPRMIVGTQSETDDPHVVYAESDVSDVAKNALKRGGYPLKEVPPHTDWMGHANIVRFDEAAENGLTADSDPRSDGAGRVTEIMS